MAFPTTGLTHYYKSNSNMNDNVGTSHGTDINTPTYTTGKIGNAITMAATSSQYSSLPNNVFPWGTNTLSINMWIKMTSTGGNQSWIMTARTSQGFLFYKSGTNTIDFSKPNVVSTTYNWTGIDTNWHMWTCVSDGSGMRVYLDGNSTPVASNANTVNFVDPIGDTMEAGAYRSAGAIQAGWYADGQFDEIGIWNVALSTTDITTLYNAGVGITYPDSPLSLSIKW